MSPLSDFLNGQDGTLNKVSQNPLFQSVLQASGGVNCSASGITMTGDAVTASPQNAQALVDVLRFLVNMLSTGGNNGAGATIADEAQFTVNGSTAHLTLSLTEQQAEQLFTSQPKKAALRPRK